MLDRKPELSRETTTKTIDTEISLEDEISIIESTANCLLNIYTEASRALTGNQSTTIMTIHLDSLSSRILPYESSKNFLK